MTSPFQRHEEITIEEYVTFDDDLRRSIEVIDGVAFPREQRSRGPRRGFRITGSWTGTKRARLSLSTMPWSAMGASTFRSESRTETATTPP